MVLLQRLRPARAPRLPLALGGFIALAAAGVLSLGLPGLLAIGLWVVARWIDGPRAHRALLLAPLLFGSLPILVTLQVGNCSGSAMGPGRLGRAGQRLLPLTPRSSRLLRMQADSSTRRLSPQGTGGTLLGA